MGCANSSRCQKAKSRPVCWASHVLAVLPPLGKPFFKSGEFEVRIVEQMGTFDFLLRTGNTTRLAPGSFPAQTQSPGVSIPWAGLLSLSVQSFSKQHTRAASAQQGLQRGSFPPLCCTGGLIKIKPLLLRKHNHQTCGCPRAQQSCPQ